MLEIQGYIKNIIFRNEENLYTVAVLETSDGDLTVVGMLPRAELGTYYDLEGHMVYHDKYGEQFDIQTAHISMPKSSDSIEKYLSSGILPHIGKRTAKRIVERFGEDTLEIMEDNPQRLKEIKGLGQVKIKAIVEAMDEHRTSRDSMLFLHEMGFGTSQAAKIYNKYKDQTINVIKANPYKLIDDIQGIGFKIADKTALKSGYAIDSDERVLAGLKYCLENAASRNGDTYLKKGQLLQKASDLLGLGEEHIENLIIRKTMDGSLVQQRIDGEDAIYYERLYRAEDLTASRMVQIGLEDPGWQAIEHDQVLEESILDEDQKDAVRQVFHNKISIITGGPGTGKTSIVKAIVEVAEKNDISILLAAPTGRAAKRLEESTSKEASTIHRMLKYYMAEGGFQFFDHDRDNPLEADLIIIDEASMIDIELMSNFVDAIKAETSLVLVGDIDQLPSVGPGNVLKDMINSGICKVVTLEKIYRQAEDSSIVTNAHRINNGDLPIVNQGKDFFFLPTSSSLESSDLILDLITRRLPQYYKFDPLEDIQVLSVMKKGDLGTIELNRKLQAVLNPSNSQDFIEIGNSIYRKGDKVMQQKNNYNLKYRDESSNEDMGVFNGDMGIIEEINPDKQEMIIRFDDNRLAKYEKENIGELMHAYAITIHKSQGSEFPVVIIPIFPGPYMLLTRNIIYTGVTRAKKLVVLVGSQKTLKEMIDNDEISSRDSSLDIRMREKVELFKGVL